MNKNNIFNKLCFLTVVIACFNLVACQRNSLRSTLGISSTGPDEFSVLSYRPLTTPPNFDLPEPAINKQEVIINHMKAPFSFSGGNSYLAENTSSNEIYSPPALSSGEDLLLNKVRNTQATNPVNSQVTGPLNPVASDTNIPSFNVDKGEHNKNKIGKDATLDPPADKSMRTYNQPPEIIKEVSQPKTRICDIKNGQIQYCDKNAFMKKLSVDLDSSKGSKPDLNTQ
jgi:hypothetical protein